MSDCDILPQAVAELDDAAVWYEKQAVGLGFELLDDYRRCLSQALAARGLGSSIGSTQEGAALRRYRLVRFDRYAIIMADIRGTPTVLAFEHSSRRPKYWNERT